MKNTFTTIFSLVITLTLVFRQQNYVTNATVIAFAGNPSFFNNPSGVAIDGIGIKCSVCYRLWVGSL